MYNILLYNKQYAQIMLYNIAVDNRCSDEIGSYISTTKRLRRDYSIYRLRNCI